MSKSNRRSYNKKTDSIHVGDGGRYYKGLFNKFKCEHPELLCYGTWWEPHGYREIKVDIPRQGVLLYNEIGTTTGKITWIKRYIDEQVVKQKEREMRPDMYRRFLSEIDIYQRETGATQGEIASMTGFSRKSINRYLSGTVIPKVSTMRIIANELDIDI